MQPPAAVGAQQLVIHVVEVAFAPVTEQLYLLGLPAPVETYAFLESQLAMFPAILPANWMLIHALVMADIMQTETLIVKQHKEVIAMILVVATVAK
jgi:hypothetical protein